MRSEAHWHDGALRGSVNVYGDDLSSGVYTYALVADGQVVNAKKMAKRKR